MLCLHYRVSVKPLIASKITSHFLQSIWPACNRISISNFVTQKCGSIFAHSVNCPRRWGVEDNRGPPPPPPPVGGTVFHFVPGSHCLHLPTYSVSTKNPESASCRPVLAQFHAGSLLTRCLQHLAKRPPARYLVFGPLLVNWVAQRQ